MIVWVFLKDTVKNLVQPRIGMLLNNPFLLYFSGCYCIVLLPVTLRLHHPQLSNFPHLNIKFSQCVSHPILLNPHINLRQLSIVASIDIAQSDPTINQLLIGLLVVFLILLNFLEIKFFPCIIHFLSIWYFQADTEVVNRNDNKKHVKVKDRDKASPT